MEAVMRDVSAEATRGSDPAPGTASEIGSRMLGERVVAMARVAAALHMACASREAAERMSPVRRGPATLRPVGGAGLERAGLADFPGQETAP